MINNQQNKLKLSATLSWILYDFANTIYSMNVVSMYFSTWVIVDLDLGDKFVGYANSISMLIVAMTLPILGEFSDRKNLKIRYLFFYTLACVIATAFIGVVGQSSSPIDTKIIWIIILFIIANYSYQGGLVFYNALLPLVCTHRSLGRVSGYGVAFGYFGSIVGLILVLPFVEGSIYGLKIPYINAGGSAAAFLPTAILFFIFSLPIFFFIQEPSIKEDIKKIKLNIRQSFKKIWDSISNTKKYPGVRRFLIAKYFYEDAIHTIIIFMAVYAQKVMLFSKSETTTFFIAVIPSAIIGSALCGIISDHIGPKKTLIFVLFGWGISLTVLVCTMKIWIFWVLGGMIGVLMGSTWTAARPLLITLVPKDMLGEFFGLYSLSGKLAAIMGPLIWVGIVELFSHKGSVYKYKAAVVALMFIMIIGLILLFKVPDKWKKTLNSVGQ